MTLILQWVRSYIKFLIRLESGGVIRSIIDAIAFPTMKFKIIKCKGDSPKIIKQNVWFSKCSHHLGKNLPVRIFLALRIMVLDPSLSSKLSTQ